MQRAVNLPPNTGGGAMETTEDVLLGGRVRLRQPRHGFRAGSDAVLLAAAVPATEGRVLEAGCGTGVGLLCLAARVPGLSVTGLEIQPDLAELARFNFATNGFAGRIDIVTGDLRRPPPALHPPYDHAFANPPFFAAGRHAVSPVPARALARSEGAADDLAAWVSFLYAMVRDGGTVTLIQRAERLAELLALMPAVVVLPLLPAAGKAAKRLIVRGVKGAEGAPSIREGFVLHPPHGGYSDAAEAILRHAAALAF